ncbi:hypothetical protein [Pseudonocardia acaciae]|uniref:hypothetical protein n=1 Tax=Pseudonocardia acaciae TaxID=551276 RepID=UPI000684AC45|nr:hypothetical protein [Pseudonocardia acaciae]
MAKTSYAELNAVLDQARRSSSPITVTDDQLLGLQYRWSTALSARLDSAIEFAGPEPLVDAVAAAWRTLAAENRTLRAVLDAHEDRSEALAEAQRWEYRMLALGAGVSAMSDPVEDSVRLGRAFRDLIRSGRRELSPELATVA